jgi:hypothetical protein
MRTSLFLLQLSGAVVHNRPDDGSVGEGCTDSLCAQHEGEEEPGSVHWQDERL